MTYDEIKDRLNKCEVMLNHVKNGSPLPKGAFTIERVQQLESVKQILKQKLLIMEENIGVIQTDDENKAKELAKAGATVKLTAEQGEEGAILTREETRVLAKEVISPLVDALRTVGDEVSRVVLKDVEDASFTVYVEYSNDFEDEFSFYIESNTLHLVDFSFDKEIGEVGFKPSGEAIVHKDILKNNFVKHFEALNESEMSNDDFDALLKQQIEDEEERKGNSYTRNYDDAEAGVAENYDQESDREKYLRAFDMYKQNKSAVDNKDLKEKLLKAAKKLGIKLDLREGELSLADEERNPTDTITMDVPLFIRILEYSKEDAEEDMDLHDVAERAVEMSKEKEVLSMEHYDELIPPTGEVTEASSGKKA